MEKVGFILHGKIRRKKTLKESLIARFSNEYVVVFYETLRPRHAAELTRQALQEKCDFIIAVGGDGTLNEMVNGYIQAGGCEQFTSCLGVLPSGTGNDFARGIGIEKRIDQLAGLIKNNQPRMLDAGAVAVHLPDGSQEVRYFDNIADMGFGAEVVARVNGVHIRKVLLGGSLTFILAVLRTFITFRHKNVRISWEGFEWEGRVLCLVVANGRYFGSGVGIAPEAVVDDGMFDIVLLADLSIIDYIRYFIKLRRCEKIDHPEASYYRARQVTVESQGAPVIIEADGEIEGYTPVTFSCLPGVLRFLAP